MEINHERTDAAGVHRRVSDLQFQVRVLAGAFGRR